MADSTVCFTPSPQRKEDAEVTQRLFHNLESCYEAQFVNRNL